MSANNANPRIAFLCLPGLQTFLSDIVAWAQARFDTRTCFSSDPQQVAATVAWADVVWVEWANELAAGLTNNEGLLGDKQVICRLHSYEAFDQIILKINWSRVNHLICVAPHILEVIKARVPDLDQRCKHIALIPNGIELDRFAFKKRHKGFNLAYMGYINYKKGPMLLLQLLKELTLVDSRYHLDIAGEIQDLRYELYFNQMIDAMGLNAHVTMSGWVDEIGPWLADKDYILCTSLLESQGLGLMEAMACGIKPVIHNFVGARDIYPHASLWNTITEGRDLVLDDHYDSTAYREWIRRKYSLASQLEKVAALLGGNPGSGGCVRRVTGRPAMQPVSSDESRPDRSAVGGRSDSIAPQVEQMLRQVVHAGMHVLDIGCGNDATARFMRAQGADMVAVDVSEAIIAATERDPAADPMNDRFIEHEHMESSVSFDLITVIGTLNRIPEKDLPAFVHYLHRHLSPKGVVCLQVADGRFIRHRQAIDGKNGDRRLTAHQPDAILSAFADRGLHLYHLNFYGDAVPLECNAYLFSTEAAFEQAFKVPV